MSAPTGAALLALPSCAWCQNNPYRYPCLDSDKYMAYCTAMDVIARTRDCAVVSADGAVYDRYTLVHLIECVYPAAREAPLLPQTQLANGRFALYAHPECALTLDALIRAARELHLQ